MTIKGVLIFGLIISNIALAQRYKRKLTKYDDIGPTPTAIAVSSIRSSQYVYSAPKKGNPRCASYSNCSFNIDILDQGSSSIVSKMDGNKNTCAPVASAMLLSGIMKELHSSTRPAGKMNTYANLENNPDRVKLLGDGMMANSASGTLPFNVPFVKNLKKFFQQNFKFSKAQSIEHKAYGSLFTYPKRDSNWFIKDMRSKKAKTGYLMTLTRHKKKGRKWIRVHDDTSGFNKASQIAMETFRLGGHVVAMTGYTGDRLQIHDPWGLTYFVKMKKEKIKTCGLCFKADKAVITPIGSKAANGREGFVHSTSRKGQKVILRQYVKLGAY